MSAAASRLNNMRALGFLTGAILVLTGLLGRVYVGPQPAPEFPLCLFKAFTHLPCLLCGLTRSFVLIGRGQWYASLDYYPLGLPIYILAIAVTFLGLCQPAWALRLTDILSRRPALLAIGLALLFCWAWKLTHNPDFW